MVMYFYFFALFILIERSISRKFRLMDPTTRKYVGFTKKDVKLVDFEKSALFEDVAAPRKKNFVKMLIEDDKNDGVFSIFMKRNNHSFVFPMKRGKNKFWRAQHFGRDLVNIRPYLNTRKCLTYNRSQKQFQMKICRPRQIFKDQKFLIASKDGIWKGNTANGYFIGDPDLDVMWGVCSTCIPGGFGSEDQGKVQDILRNIFDENIDFLREFSF